MTAALKKKVPTIKSQSDQTLDMKPRVVSRQKLENLQRTSRQTSRQTENSKPEATLIPCGSWGGKGQQHSSLTVNANNLWSRLTVSTDTFQHLEISTKPKERWLSLNFNPVPQSISNLV